MDYQGALAIAKRELDHPPHFGIANIGEADDFWAFYGGFSDSIVRDANPSIVVVMKGTGEVIRPLIPSEEGFALLSRVTRWKDRARGCGLDERAVGQISDISTPSGVRGIKYPETAGDARFMRFFDLVQSAARSDGKVFFLWAGEGHDLTTDGIDCEDLSGWLVDEADADRFERIWLDDWHAIPDDLDDTFCFARWSSDTGGAITVHFE